jgi:hypothetical protein
MPWARLRFAGIRRSLRRLLRLMRENDLLAPGRVGSPPANLLVNAKIWFTNTADKELNVLTNAIVCSRFVPPLAAVVFIVANFQNQKMEEQEWHRVRVRRRGAGQKPSSAR